MDSLTTLRALFSYNDVSNGVLFDAAAAFDNAKLDEPFDMGMKSLRATLAHIVVGEVAWLERAKQTPGFKWSSVEVPQSIEKMLDRAARTTRERDSFLAAVTPQQLQADQRYLDSTAGAFVATLHEMLVQSFVHSTHHRAQAVNMIRRLGGPLVDVDFMYARRRPVPRSARAAHRH